MTVWIRFVYDYSPIVTGVYASEMEARRAVDFGDHVMEITLPCNDVRQAIADGVK